MSLPKVVDNESFREWCASMHFSTKHASAVLDISRSIVYKYLKEDEQRVEIKGPVVLLCNCISEMDSAQRFEYVKKRLVEAAEKEIWPAQVSIHAHSKS